VDILGVYRRNAFSPGHGTVAISQAMPHQYALDINLFDLCARCIGYSAAPAWLSLGGAGRLCFAPSEFAVSHFTEATDGQHRQLR